MQLYAAVVVSTAICNWNTENHKKDTEKVGRIPSTKLTTDHRSYPEEQGNKRRSTERTGQRRVKDTTGERNTSSGWTQNAQLTVQQTGYQPIEEEKAGQGKRGGQHFMTLYLQEESAGANFNCHRISSLQPPIFSPYPLWPNGWMDQDATWHRGRPRPWPQCVRWGPSPPPKKSDTTAPNFRPMCIVAKLLDGSRCHLVRRKASAQATLC